VREDKRFRNRERPANHIESAEKKKEQIKRCRGAEHRGEAAREKGGVVGPVQLTAALEGGKGREVARPTSKKKGPQFLDNVYLSKGLRGIGLSPGLSPHGPKRKPHQPLLTPERT